eukprot:1334668-Amorphochlora_amoeboformis.AAC.3
MPRDRAGSMEETVLLSPYPSFPSPGRNIIFSSPVPAGYFRINFGCYRSQNGTGARRNSRFAPLPPSSRSKISTTGVPNHKHVEKYGREIQEQLPAGRGMGKRR